MSRLNRSQAATVSRLRKGYYDVSLPPRLKVCPNPDCPKPMRTYAYVKTCPFCGAKLVYEEA